MNEHLRDLLDAADRANVDLSRTHIDQSPSPIDQSPSPRDLRVFFFVDREPEENLKNLRQMVGRPFEVSFDESGPRNPAVMWEGWRIVAVNVFADHPPLRPEAQVLL